MRSRRNRVSTIAGAILLASMMIGDLGWAPSARADGDPINGTYRATSVGEWAKTNDAFHNQATVTSTWTITSSCSNAQECTGQVRPTRDGVHRFTCMTGQCGTSNTMCPTGNGAPTAPRLPDNRRSLSFLRAQMASSSLGQRHWRVRIKPSAQAAPAE